MPGGISTASIVSTKPIVTVADWMNTFAALVIGALIFVGAAYTAVPGRSRRELRQPAQPRHVRVM